MKLTSLDRILLLFTVILASYQVAVGIDSFSALPIIAYTIAFGVLLIAGLLLFILGLDVLEAPVVVIISTIIPLSLATGLAWQHLASHRTSYLIFASIGFVAIGFTPLIPMSNRARTIILAVIHGIAGMTIFLLPIILSLQSQTRPLFSLVGIGGALIGLGGLLLSFLKMGRPIVSRDTILRVFPGWLLLTTICFVAGFKFGV